MAAKRYSPQVADAVVEALVACFHFKDDLASFLVRCGVPPQLVQRHQFTRNGPPKVVAARGLVDELVVSTTSGTKHLTSIIEALCDEDLDFPRLRKLEDGASKVQKARVAVRSLKDTVGDLARRAASSTADFSKSREEAEIQRRRTSELTGLHQRFLSMFAATDRQQRGRDFEKLLKDLFEFFDLSPRGSFRHEGEEVDGSIVLDSMHMLVEAKWEKDPIETAPIGIFRQKIDDKFKTTLGMFVSMSGFTKSAIAKAGGGRAKSMILVEGRELMPVLEGRVDLRDLISRKIRRAHETGDALFQPFQ